MQAETGSWRHSLTTSSRHRWPCKVLVTASICQSSRPPVPRKHMYLRWHRLGQLSQGSCCSRPSRMRSVGPRTTFGPALLPAAAACRAPMQSMVALPPARRPGRVGHESSLSIPIVAWANSIHIHTTTLCCARAGAATTGAALGAAADTAAGSSRASSAGARASGCAASW
jgi:hypothetical protein